jgi:hypothetical protein
MDGIARAKAQGKRGAGPQAEAFRCSKACEKSSPAIEESLPTTAALQAEELEKRTFSGPLQRLKPKPKAKPRAKPSPEAFGLLPKRQHLALGYAA